MLEKSDNKLSFFLDLLAPDQRDSQFEAFLCLLQWFRLGCTISDDLFRAIREAINQVGQEAYNTEALQSRLLSLFPDIADDLTRATAYVLNNPIAAPFWVRCVADFSFNSQESIRPLPQYTNLMTEGVYWLLSQVLSSPFKRFSGTALTASAPLEIVRLLTVAEYSVIFVFFFLVGTADSFTAHVRQQDTWI